MGRRRGRWLVLLALMTLTASSLGARAEPTPTQVHFTAVGDYGMNAATTGAVLNALDTADPDVHLALGDLSYGATGAEQAWCDFVTARVGAGFPFELLAGNHESNGQNGNINDFSACLPNQLPGAIGTYGRQYYVDVPQQDPLVRFVMISPNLPFPDGTWSYDAGSARHTWTANAIDGARLAEIPWVVVGMHKPCLSMGSYGCDIGADLTNLLLSKKVDLVLMGHDHNYQRTKQLALGTGCATLAIGSYDADCVEDSDSSLAAGAGTVFVTVGTGGIGQYNVNTSDTEAPYFAAYSGANSNLTYGFGDYDVTPDVLQASFVRGAGGTFTDSFTITRGPAPPNQVPAAAFTSAVSSLTASFDASASSDPDGAVASYAWAFGDGETGTGATPQHTYDTEGTYDVTLTVTDNEGATDSVTHPVTVTDPGDVVVVAADDFSRTVASGWGSADVGGVWSVNSSVSSVSGGVGRNTMRSAGTGPLSYLNGVSTSDLDLTYEVSLDKVPTPSNARVDLASFLRRTSGGDYKAMVRVLGTGAVRVSVVRNIVGGSSNVVLGSEVTLAGVTYTAGDVLEVRGQATGTSPTTVRLKVWKAGTAEPTNWTVTATDSTAALQQAGSIGFHVYLSGSATNAPLQARHDALRGVVASTLP